MSCLDVDEILSPTGDSLLHANLQALYVAYRKAATREGREPLEAIRWLALGHRGRRRDAVLDVIGLYNWRRLREGLRSSNPIMIDLISMPRPSRFFSNGQPTQRFNQLRRFLLDGFTARKLRDRLGNLFDSSRDSLQILRSTREVSLGYMNIIKGNIGEVLSMPRQLLVLEALSRQYGRQTILITDLRAQIGGSGAPRLFSDNIIGRVTSDGHLEVLHVFEVKSSLNGGIDGTLQVLRWDNRISDGVILHLPSDASVFRLGGGTGTRAPQEMAVARYIRDVAPNHSSSSRGAFTFDSASSGSSGSRAINLQAADRNVIATLNRADLTQASIVDTGISVTRLEPTDFSLAGLDSISSYGPDVARMELDVSHDEIEYLAAFYLMSQ